jgi:hypothetical protein
MATNQANNVLDVEKLPENPAPQPLYNGEFAQYISAPPTGVAALISGLTVPIITSSAALIYYLLKLRDKAA